MSGRNRGYASYTPSSGPATAGARNNLIKKPYQTIKIFTNLVTIIWDGGVHRGPTNDPIAITTGHDMNSPPDAIESSYLLVYQHSRDY